MSQFHTYSIYSLSTGVISSTISLQEVFRLKYITEDGFGCIQGEYDPLSQKINLTTGEVEDYIPPPPSPSYVWNGETKRWDYVKTVEDYALEVRETRDRLISSTDWVVTKAIENSSPIPIEWKTYRDALRDIPKQEGFPKDVIWPSQPT